MFLRFLIIMIIAVSMTGCATTSKPTSVNQLQIRVAQIEQQLDEQSQDIMDLKADMDVSSARSRNAAFTPKPARDILGTAQPAPVKSPANEEALQNILRVPVTPQEVQKALKGAGFYANGAIDGKLGAGSQKAIKEFQAAHNLESDGIVGKKTWEQLKGYLE